MILCHVWRHPPLLSSPPFLYRLIRRAPDDPSSTTATYFASQQLTGLEGGLVAFAAVLALVVLVVAGRTVSREALGGGAGGGAFDARVGEQVGGRTWTAADADGRPCGDLGSGGGGGGGGAGRHGLSLLVVLALVLILHPVVRGLLHPKTGRSVRKCGHPRPDYRAAPWCPEDLFLGAH